MGILCKIYFLIKVDVNGMKQNIYCQISPQTSLGLEKLLLPLRTFVVLQHDRKRDEVLQRCIFVQKKKSENMHKQVSTCDYCVGMQKRNAVDKIMQVLSPIYYFQLWSCSKGYLLLCQHNLSSPSIDPIYQSNTFKLMLAPIITHAISYI